MNLSELGKTSLVQYDIKLDNPTPFKEHYQRIPPHQYEEVKKHLQEMMVIGAHPTNLLVHGQVLLF